ncbi:MAG: RhoGEF Scd1 [Amphiamblys sp. WSBS2006]|nr:MAG: RhoGEF Scd1 [Amphiamblys sp. WSBS2006]
MADVVLPTPKKKEKSLSLVQRCKLFVDSCSVIPGAKERYMSPLLEYFGDRSDLLLFVRKLLQQGGILCEIINVLKGNILGEIDPWKETPLRDETLKNIDGKNVEVFLCSCKEDLYMTDEQLFSIDDVFEEDLNTLSSIVKSALSLLGRINTVGKLKIDSLLKEIPEEKRISTALTPKAKTVEGGGKLEVRAGTKLGYLLNELVETERVFVCDLERLSEQRRDCKYSSLFDEETLEAIFMNIDDVLLFQRGFLMDMERRTQSRFIEDIDVSGLFIKNTDRFKVYEQFCTGYGRACEVVRGNETKLKGVGVLEDPVREYHSYLIKPTQRICRYPLLLREIQKKIPKESGEYKKIGAAIKAVGGIVANVNEFQRLNDNIIKANEILSAVDDKEECKKERAGPLKLYENASLLKSGQEKKYLFVLYERRLVFLVVGGDLVGSQLGFGRKGTAAYRVKAVVELSSIVLAEEASSPRNAMRLGYRTPSAQEKEMSILFKTAEILERWVTTLNAMLSELIEGPDERLSLSVRGGLLGEFYLLRGFSLPGKKLIDIKQEIIRRARDDFWVLDVHGDKLRQYTDATESEVEEMRLKIKDSDGDWLHLLDEEDLRVLATHQTTVKLSLLF